MPDHINPPLQDTDDVEQPVIGAAEESTSRSACSWPYRSAV
jgi:hypothetical protein